MLNKEINNLAIQVKAILESEERSYIDKNQKKTIEMVFFYGLKLNHFKISFRHTTIWASPILWNIIP